jgi:hypothetical protein
MEEPKGELRLGYPSTSVSVEGLEHRSVRGDSRTDHHGVRSGHSFQVVPSEIHPYSELSELGCTS